MGDISKQKLEDLTEWKRFYPEFEGWNADWQEGERWWLELRRTPSRAESVKLLRQMALAQEAGGDEDFLLLLLARQVRGPFNITLDGEEPGDFVAFVRALDSARLIEEITEHLNSMNRLDEGERGNSDGRLGSDTESPASEAETESTPAPDASQTPPPADAPASTTPPPEKGSPSETPAPSVGEK